jgi:hypothetical protein
MSVESATYISDLNVANPTHTDGINQGDSHMRLIKSTLQATFPNVTGAMTATHTQLNNAGAAAATAGLLIAPANGATSAVLRLTGAASTGAYIVANVSTSGQAGVLGLYSNNSTNTVTTLGATLDGSGNFSAVGSINGSLVKQNGNTLVPTGIVAMWSGSQASIPAGWHLCDGTSGTPNLLNRFIACAGSTYTVAQVGGAVSATVTSDSQGVHSHGGTASAGPFGMTGSVTNDGAHSHSGSTGSHALSVGELPAHDHGISGVNLVTDGGSTGGFQTGGYPVGVVGGATVGSTQGHAHTISADGTHGHTVTVSNAPAHTHSIAGDGSHAHNVTVATLPPYYALCYIMKL